MWQALIDQGLLTADTRTLIDLRLAGEAPRYDGLQRMVLAAERRDSWPLRRAYLVGSPTQFGVVRQMQAMAPATMKIDIFNVEGDALAWLASSD